MPTIYVSRNGNSLKLKLRDSEGHQPGNDDLTTFVDPDDTVTWQLDDNSGLSSMVSITKADPSIPKYSNSVQLLVADPVVVNNVGTGKVIKPSPGSGKFENYNVGFTVPNDTTTHYDDPKIQMN